MKRALITAVLAVVFITPAFAADTPATTKGPGHGIEQKKTEILQHIQERITNSQAEMTCVKSAQSHDELKACREKYRPQHKHDRSDKNGK